MTLRRFQPSPALEVRADRHGAPAAFLWRRRWRNVAKIERSWVVQTEWWKGPDEAIDRAYFDLRAYDGLRCVVYLDRVAGEWRMESIYD